MPGRASTGSRSHHSTYGIFALDGAGMFFDGYDLYVAAGVLAATSQSNFSTLPQNLQFLSPTFVGMTLGSLITGFVGDKMGRRFHLPDQPSGARACLARRRLRAGHDAAHRLPLHPRPGTRRLFDHDGIRAAEDARALARLHGLHRSGGFHDRRSRSYSRGGVAADEIRDRDHQGKWNESKSRLHGGVA